MSLKKCLEGAKNLNDADKKFILEASEKYKKTGQSEIESDVQALLDYHGKLQETMSTIRQATKQPVLPITIPSVFQQIKKLTPKKEESLLSELKIEDKPGIDPPIIEVTSPVEAKNTPPAGVSLRDRVKKMKLPGSEFRRVLPGEVENISPERWREFEAWAKVNIPQVPIFRLKHLIRMVGGGYAWGALENGVIKVYENSVVGTEYHEAFEAVWKFFVPIQEQADIYDEFTKRQGKYIDRISGNTISYASATLQQAKEKLADEFAEYKGGRPVGFIARLFDQLKRLFRYLFASPTAARELFEKIDTGYYKSSTVPEERLPGIEYKAVGDLTESETHQIVEHLTARIVQRLFADKKSLFKPKDIAASETFDQLRAEFDGIFFDEEWTALTRNVKDSLAVYNIRFDEQEDKLSFNDQERNRNDYAVDAFKVDVKKSAPAAVRMLISTLVDSTYDSNGNLVDNTGEMGLLQLAKFGKTFIQLMEGLSNTNGLDNQLAKLKELSNDNANYVRLFNRLRGNSNTGQIRFDELNFDDWRLLISFHNTFAKQKPEALIQYINADGSAYTQGADISSTVNQQIFEWTENMRKMAKNKNAIIFYDKNTKTYNIDQREVKKTSIKSPFKFLKNIGIPFSEEMFESLKKNEKKIFNDAVGAIIDNLGKNNQLFTVTGKTLDVGTPLRHLSELYVRLTRPELSSVLYNVENEQQQIYVQNNFASVFVNDFNSVKTKSELLDIRPELNDIFSENSQVLKLGGRFFDEKGNRREESPLKLGYINGTVDQQTGRSKHTSNLNIAERMVQEINQNLSGWYYILVPADSATEWMINLGNNISFQQLQTSPGGEWTRIYNIFDKYLLDEVMLAGDYNNRNHNLQVAKTGKELRFFKEILGEDLANEAVDASDIEGWIDENANKIHGKLKEFITSMNSQTASILSQYEQIDINEGSVTFNKLDSGFATANKLKTTLKEDEFNDLLTFVNVNYMINNMEYHKVMFGDPAQFKDELKRIKSFLSPRQTTLSLPEFDIWANKEMNKGLKEGDIGYHRFKSYTSTVTIRNLEVLGSTALSDAPESIKKEYEDLDEADAQAWILSGAYREMDMKNGNWTEEAEAFYQWDSALARQAIEKSLPGDEKILANKPTGYFARVIKPIVTGIKPDSGNLELILDKTSMFPMFYSFVKGANLEELYFKMQDQQIGYAIVNSGRKVGAEMLEDAYLRDGKFNKLPFNSITNVNWSSFGIQVETSYKEGNDQTRGSQLTKLATLNLMAAGVPVDVEFTLGEWSTFDEARKSKESPLYKEIKHNQRLLEEMTDIGYARLLKDLGITDTGEGFIMPDKTRVAKLLRDELTRRDVSSNVKDAISLNEQGEFTVPLEATNVYQQIKNVLFSVVDKYVLSPKLNGGPKVQVSAAMWESNKRQAVYKKDGKWSIVEDYNTLSDDEKDTVKLTSNDLKFYTRRDGKVTACEVYLPHWFSEEFRRKGVNKTDEELLTFLNSNAEGRRILTGIGFRIPTQELNSVEVFKVKGFLPQEMGDTIVVPSEITKKAGSDFDIDKLNTYLKNIYIDGQGNPRLLRFDKLDTNSDQELTDFYERNLLSRFKKLLSKEKDVAVEIEMNELFPDLLDSGVTDLTDEYVPSLEEFLISNKGKSIYDLNKTRIDYKRVVENEYFESLERLILHPSNYERLITPNSEGQLKKLRDKLVKISEEQFGSTSKSLLSRSYMVQTRHNNMVGKGGVGIAAIAQTGHSLSQRQPIIIDTSKIPSLSTEDKTYLKNGTILLDHNSIDIDGKSFATLSQIRDQDGVYISDKLSAYINGFVDIAKDTFIIEIGSKKNVAGTFLFLERIGVPTEQVVAFMNQPIVRDLLKNIESHGWSKIHNSQAIKDTRDMYPTKKKATKLDKNLFANIEKKYGKKTPFTDADNGQQQLILDEFLKYAKMAEHLFLFTQGTNFDTANISDTAFIAKKNEQAQYAKDNLIISSAEELLNNSFIGNTADKANSSQEALGTVLKFESVNIRGTLNQVLAPFIKQGMYVSQKNLQKIGNGIVSSFIDYLVHTNDTSISSRIKDLVIETETSVANQLFNIKSQIADHSNSDLFQNPVLQVLQSTSEIDAINSVFLKVKDSDPYTTDLYIGAMRELKLNPHTAALYENLVKLSFLQSGVAKSPMSFTHIIPVEDYAKVLSPVIAKLEDIPNLNNFADNYAFFRNNWHNSDIVPTFTPYLFVDDKKNPIFDPITQDESWFHYTYAFGDDKRPALMKTLPKKSLLFLSPIFNSRVIGYPVIKINRVVRSKESGDQVDLETMRGLNPVDFVKRKKKGDTSLNMVYGYRQVTDSLGNPLIIPGKDHQPLHVYKAINLWGAGQNAQEYYDDARPSQYQNSTKKVIEIPDDIIVDTYMGNPIEPERITRLQELIASGQVKKEC